MPIGDILASFEKAQETAAAANKKRYEQSLAIYDEIIGRYGPGGTFMAGAEAELGRAKERDVSAEMAQSVSTGMYGTTRPGTAGRRWEAEIGAPSRLKLEDLRMERLSQAQIGKAGAVERVEDVYPDYAMMAQYMSQIGAAGGVGGGAAPSAGYDKGPSPWESGFMGGGFGVSPTLGGPSRVDPSTTPDKRTPGPFGPTAATEPTAAPVTTPTAAPTTTAKKIPTFKEWSAQTGRTSTATYSAVVRRLTESGQRWGGYK